MIGEIDFSAKFLRQEFINEARVLDVKKGYISVSSFNLRMKPQVLSAASKLIADFFKDDDINAVHGIPHSGMYFATAVSLALADIGKDIRLHASRKDQFVPSSWKDVYRKEVRSFSSSLGGVDVYSGINFSFVKKGDKILLVDDVCATGGTAAYVIKGLLERNIKVVGFAVLFDKVFQGGLAEVEALGVKTFSCIRVKKITADDRVILQ